MGLGVSVIRLLCLLLSACIFITGCAVSPRFFYDNRQSLSDLDLCRTLLDSRKRETDWQFVEDVKSDAGARSLTYDGCLTLIDEANKKAATAAAIALGVIALALAARSGGGGGGTSNQPSATDYLWEWDEFYNEHYQLVWTCRGVQTGQFADLGRCNGKFKSDWKWPSKSAAR